jgi:hypothetical protein
MAIEEFVQRTITKSGDWIPLSVVPLETAHLQFWQERIQPVIRSLGPSRRVDWDWNWFTITSFSRVTGTTFRQQPAAYTIIHHDPATQRDMVCGLVQLARRFLYLPDLALKETCRSAGFLWTCSTAPTEALQQFFYDDFIPKRLAQLCIHIAVTCAYQDRHGGRICLHAHPDAPKNAQGLDLLLEFYRNGPVSMSQLDPNIEIPGLRGLLAPNDGRYFYYSEWQAMKFVEQFQGYR